MQDHHHSFSSVNMLRQMRDSPTARAAVHKDSLISLRKFLTSRCSKHAHLIKDISIQQLQPPPPLPQPQVHGTQMRLHPDVCVKDGRANTLLLYVTKACSILESLNRW